LASFDQDKGTFVYGITAGGVIVGNDDVGTSFSAVRGEYKLITIPSYPSATVYGVSQNGTTVAGYTFTGLGFVYPQNGTVQTLQFPGFTYAFAFGVNDSEETVGYFYNSGSGQLFHPFLWTPTAADQVTEKK
jgi:hypothetical protein